MELHPEARELLESDAFVHFATLRKDGSPASTMIWVGIEGDEIVSGHLFKNRKVQNVERDPRVSLSIEGEGLGDNGLHRYLWIRGKARVTEGGAPELLQRLAHVYMGPDVKFPPMDDPPDGFIIRTTPERVGGVGPWAD